MVFNKIKKAFSSSIGDDNSEEEYIEIDLEGEKRENKVVVKLFSLDQYENVNEILNALREGYTIAIIDIKILKKRDPIELKRAISKIKKTTSALEGNIVGFGENIVVVTPSFAKIHREISSPKTEDKYKDF